MRPTRLVIVKARLQGPVDRPRLFLSRQTELATTTSLQLLPIVPEGSCGKEGDGLNDFKPELAECGLGTGCDLMGVVFLGILKFLTADELGKQLGEFGWLGLDDVVVMAVVLEFRVQLRTWGFGEVMMWLKREWFCRVWTAEIEEDKEEEEEEEEGLESRTCTEIGLCS